MADYQRLVARLRAEDIASELYLGEGINAQLKYADKRGSLCAVIQGSNERGAPGGPQVVIRDLALGAELAKANKDRADYLEMRQRAQVTVPEADLVARVREVSRAAARRCCAPKAVPRNYRIAGCWRTSMRRQAASPGRSSIIHIYVKYNRAIWRNKANSSESSGFPGLSADFFLRC